MNRIISILALAAVAASMSGCGATSLFKKRSDLVSTSSPCGPRRFEVYFAEGQARLTAPARQAINLAADQLRSCDIRKVSVLGLADSTGGPDANLTLSQRRARAVAEALTRAGWPAPAFELSAAGESGSINPAGAQEPLRRRTEVVIDAVAR